LRVRPSHALLATLAYICAAVLMTWPLSRGLGRDVPWDLGDPLLNCWILGWHVNQLGRLFHGDLLALRGMWDANIFYPEPHALAYSEHLFAQSVQILPLYALTHNLILCYDLLFLSTFVLSGLGMFLLVRELTGRPWAAFMAGLIYGFAPYRVEQFSHLQVLSSQWMPFVLLGLHRHITGGGTWPLVYATGSLIAQNLSCGYFLLYFAPFVLLFAVHQVILSRRMGDVHLWKRLALAGLVVLGATWPFIEPYRELRHQGSLTRERWEVEMFSADVYSYLTASEALRVWGDRIQGYPKSEGSLFPGVVPSVLAALGMGGFLVGAWRAAGSISFGSGPGAFRLARKALLALAFLFGLVQLLGALLFLAGLGEKVSGEIPAVHLTNLPRALGSFWLAAIVLLLVSPRARLFAKGVAMSGPAFYGLGALLAFWLSLGPTVRSLGHPLPGAGLYSWAYEHVPGFDGLRVPARFAMIVLLFLAVLAGFGAAGIEGRFRRGRFVTVGLGLLFLIEATAAPIVLNDVWAEPDFRPPPSRVYVGEASPPVYNLVAGLPETAVVVEFPFGSAPYELRYMFYSTKHRRRLVNGFSGSLPSSYLARQAVLRRPLAHRDKAWAVLRTSGSSHAIVHEDSWRRGKGTKVSAWLESHGAKRLATLGSDVLFEFEWEGDSRRGLLP